MASISLLFPSVSREVKPLVRRSAKYEPSLWSYDHIQSLPSNCIGEDYAVRAHALKDTMKTMLCQLGDPLSTLEMVDVLQRLGISYHFENEISDILNTIHHNYFKNHKLNQMNLNYKALGFRLLRQHGYHVPQDIFDNFKETTQHLKPHVYEDMVGMLNLYEASYHSYEDENILDEARDFTTKYFNENLETIEENISSLVSHALELPLHWRVPRIEAKWFINEYEKRSGMNPLLIELAKLDFNMVQAIHLEDLKHASRWWRNTGWDKKLTFARDRVVENFMWTIGFNYLPQFSLGRRTLAKVFAMITTIDDVYDVFGTLDELEQFTHVTDRWNINEIEVLPDYMKICFHGFYNTINEISYETLKSTGSFILPYLKKAWADLFKAYLVEAQWYHSGHTPTLEEYLENAYVSIAAPLALMHVNFLTSFTSAKEILQFMEQSEHIVRYSALILRLADDLGTSSDEIARGDNPKAIQCYMHETGASEDEARRYIQTLILETWKKLNKEREGANSKISQEFYNCAVNGSRTAQFMYFEGDGHGEPKLTKRHVQSLLVDPIPGV